MLGGSLLVYAVFVAALVFGYREGELDKKGVGVYVGILAACALVFLVADWPLEWLIAPTIVLDSILIITVLRTGNYRIR